jgi:signal transduction histidine kinase
VEASELPSGSGDEALRALVHSVAHDLAQPLTSLRCFLEVLSLDKNFPPVHANDLRVIEQQTDRAIALTKSISALVRDVGLPDEPWVRLDDVLNDALNDFNVLFNSGMLSLERRWDSSLYVSSSPLLRHVLLLLLSKLAGRNTRPLLLTIAATSKDAHCNIRFSWKSNAAGAQAPDGRTVLAKDIPILEQIVTELGGKLAVADQHGEVSLTLPAAPSDSASRPNVVH